MRGTARAVDRGNLRALGAVGIAQRAAQHVVDVHRQIPQLTRGGGGKAVDHRPLQLQRVLERAIGPARSVGGTVDEGVDQVVAVLGQRGHRPGELRLDGVDQALGHRRQRMRRGRRPGGGRVEQALVQLGRGVAGSGGVAEAQHGVDHPGPAVLGEAGGGESGDDAGLGADLLEGRVGVGEQVGQRDRSEDRAGQVEVFLGQCRVDLGGQDEEFGHALAFDDAADAVVPGGGRVVAGAGGELLAGVGFARGGGNQRGGALGSGGVRGRGLGGAFTRGRGASGQCDGSSEQCGASAGAVAVAAGQSSPRVGRGA